MNIKSRVRRIISFLLAGVFIGGLAYAAITSKVFMKGAMFTTSVIEIRFLKDLAGTADTNNLTSEILGVQFDNIMNYWENDYPVKIYNVSKNTLTLKSNANYSTALDPDSLRYSLYVEIFPWNDSNNNGLVDEGEVGETLGKKNFVKWKTEGFDLGFLGKGEIKSYVLRFSADGLTDTKMGKTGQFDFEFGIVQ
jgi:hypothetical protein